VDGLVKFVGVLGGMALFMRDTMLFSHYTVQTVEASNDLELWPFPFVALLMVMILGFHTLGMLHPFL
jgi:hypothetical protein